MGVLAGKSALVTGASRGIGRAIALRLAAEGAAVAINYRANLSAAEETLRSVAEAGGRGLLVPGDVASADDSASMVSACLAELGGLHIVVNNAGMSVDQLTMRLREEDWDRTLDVDLKGAFLVTKAALRPLVRQRWGRIVNISSVVGVQGNPGQAAYSAAKAGLLGFTRSVAREVATRGITVNAVTPGLIATDMTDTLPEEAREQMLAQVPMGRVGTPDDVAGVVAFLCGDDAAYITGQSLAVNGGMAMS